ncbi:hypothetical protein SAMN02910384_02227 [Pseudobutyrivibrio sp. ACV-2]|uniref:hypothetical protein n=1 Tax=Pseudobutyrivibrio sp. ACV-2 TaxID=1520801 RepID=UPI000896E9BB|nr:hypothetical protein [Pseudobutyrivibrio sp. ACV-2]SEA73871.1 hypothetical protein SAMN02910384_02227 [Pseudobutyrivibrio sp. ACV-2]
MLVKGKSLAAITLCAALLVGCGKTAEVQSTSSNEFEGTSDKKEEIVIPAINCYWAKEDTSGVYYFSDKKLYKYDDAESTIVTENLIAPYDFAVYDGTIYTLENSGDEKNPLRLFIYDKYADNFDELMSFENQVHAINTSGHYIIATTDTSDKYEIYDISSPDSPQKVDVNEVELVSEPVDDTSQVDDIHRIAIFDDLMLIRNDEGSVQVTSNK